MKRTVLAAGLLALCGCDAKLPQPESPGARLYRERCRDCHRLYAPGLLTVEMWRYQMDRMQGEMARRGVPPLSPEERRTLLDYLSAHAGR